MTVVNPIFDWNRKVDDFHDIFYTLSPVKSSGESSFVQSFGRDGKLHSINMTQPVKYGFQALFRKIIITGSPGCELFGIHIPDITSMCIPVVNKLLIGFQYGLMQNILCLQTNGSLQQGCSEQ